MSILKTLTPGSGQWRCAACPRLTPTLRAFFPSSSSLRQPSSYTGTTVSAKHIWQTKKNPKLSESLITYPLRGIHLIGKAILRLCNLFLCDMYTMTQSNKYAHYKVALTSDISNGTRVLSQLRLGAGIALRSFLAIGSVFGQRRYSDWTWSSCCRWYIFRSEPWCQHLYLLSLASYRELLLRWCLIA